VKLLGESSIGAGVRRVEALVGVDAYSFLAREHVLLNSLNDLIKSTRVEELPERISSLLSRLKEVEKELAQIKTKQALAAASSLIASAEKVNGISLLARDMGDNLSGDDLRSIALDLRSRVKGSVIALASRGSEKVVLVVAVDDDARARGVKAGTLVKLASTILGGGGGGKDDFAQGGGINGAKISEAMSAIKNALS
jgi:alanyl-tRNA synthetase